MLKACASFAEFNREGFDLMEGGAASPNSIVVYSTLVWQARCESFQAGIVKYFQSQTVPQFKSNLPSPPPKFLGIIQHPQVTDGLGQQASFPLWPPCYSLRFSCVAIWLPALPTQPRTV